MLILSDDYLYGFVEGEGCFYVGIVPSPDTKLGYQVVASFKVSQNPKGRFVLDALKKRLNAGYIKPNDNKKSSDISLAYVVRDIKSLKEKVIPFFDNKLYIKRKDFLKFKKIIEMIDQEKHKTKQGLIEIVNIAYSMNTGIRRIPKQELIKHIK